MSNNNQNDNGNFEQQIVEDGPQMRSVAMMSPPAVPMMPMRSAMVKAPPAPARLAANPKSKAAAWKVTSAPALPPIYLLERTHAHVDATAQQVATRIADCLERESIAVRFSPDETLASCTTASNVQFDVRLWLSHEPDSQTIVEIQRCQGCSHGFHSSVQAVLRAAQGRATRPSSPVREVPCSLRTEPMEVTDDCTQEALEIALDMISQGRPDMVLLGMESMAQLTASERCKVYAAKYILNGELGTKLVSIIEEPIIDSSIKYEAVQQKQLKSHGLSIMRNALSALESSGDVRATLSSRPELTRTSLLRALVNLVQQSESNCPHAACHAASILHVLLMAGPQCCRSRAENLHAAVEQAMSCRHVNLEAECQKLRLQL